MTFDFAEGLIKDNLLFVDRETKSIWSQLDGKAVSGPMKNTPLEVIPSIQTTWAHWREMHPDTKVMIQEHTEGRPYVYRNWRPGMPRPSKRLSSHDTSNLGLGLVVNGEAIYFPFPELSKVTTPIKMEIGGEVVTIHYKKEAFTAWAKDEENELLSGVLAYQDGWIDFYPNSEVFRSD